MFPNSRRCFAARAVAARTPVNLTDSAEPMQQNTPSALDHEPLLQSTAGIHIIFVNIDWKKSRQANDGATKKEPGAARRHDCFHRQRNETGCHLLL